MSRRCFLCDGPVAGGRCLLCGMPNEKTDALYHLNEQRRDHMKHASAQAKKVLKQRSIPLGDGGEGNDMTLKSVLERKSQAKKAAKPVRPVAKKKK